MDEKEAKDIYDEIVRIYDFAENILSSVELDGVEHPAVQIELAEPLIEQLEEVSENYQDLFIEWHRNKKKSKALRQKTEASIRILYKIAQNIMEAIKKLPKGVDLAAEVIKEKVLAIKKKVVEGILPTQKDLGWGKIRHGWEDLIKSHSGFANLLRACEIACTHIFRISYRLFQPDLALVGNPQNFIPGRVAIDAKTQADKESFKALRQSEKNLTRTDMFTNHINRG